MNETALTLKGVIESYLEWMVLNGYAQSTLRQTEQTLKQFLSFIGRAKYPWDKIFTHHTLSCFLKIRGPYATHAVTGLSRYLHSQGKIAQPIAMRKSLPSLSVIYEDYLVYRKKYYQAPNIVANRIRRVLKAFDDYCKQNGIDLRSLKIEHVDEFHKIFFKGFSSATRHAYRGYLRQFLSYLFHHHRILTKDLAPLIIGRREYAQAKPPRFLRPAEVKKLFSSLSSSSASGIRTYAMVHLAYTMGLRPNEISRIRLDDIGFGQQLLWLNLRKGDNPLELPIPEHTLKAVAAYIIGVRPESCHRRLFLTLHPPPRPMSPNAVGVCISNAMKKAGLDASAYWLRHTYAQNMLEAGASIFEIKEMLGHDKIESTKIYLRIHPQMMRQVLFDETL